VSCIEWSAEEETALRQIVTERVEANRLAAQKAVAEEEARKRDHEKALAKLEEEERLRRTREEVWGKHGAPASNEGVPVWFRGR
jgi:hypothetical protein